MTSDGDGKVRKDYLEGGIRKGRRVLPVGEAGLMAQKNREP
jgi:hypothetical protein